MNRKPSTATLPSTLNDGTTLEQPALKPRLEPVSTEQANAGLLLIGPLSSLPTVAALAAQCATLGEHAPGPSDFLASARQICGLIHKGDLTSIESTLTTQALSLNVLFNAMMSRATGNLGVNFERVESYMRLALKAQNQSRMTLETLANIKNPPVIYARQANVNNGGQQQVNNGSAVRSSATHTADQQSGKTELLERQHGQRMDTREASSAIPAHSNLAAVGEVNGPAQRRRKKQVGGQRLQGG